MARPTVMTQVVLRKLEEAFINGCSDEEACILAEIGTSTLSDYCKKNESFRRKKELLKNTPTLTARMEVVKALRGNPELALKYLERKKKDEFSPRTDLKHQGDPDNPLQTNITVQWTKSFDKTQERIEEILEKK